MESMIFRCSILLLLIILLQIPLHGSVLSGIADTMTAGTFAEVPVSGSVTNCDAYVPPSGNGDIFQYTDEAQWNPKSREVYIIGTARPYQMEDAQFIKYSEATNSWTIVPLPFYPGFHGYDHAALDNTTGDYYWTSTGSLRDVRRLNYSTGQWEELPHLSLNYGPQTVGIEYFPEMGGIIFVNNLYGEAAGGEIYFYTRGASNWQKIAQGFSIGNMEYFTEYNRVHHVLLFGGGNDDSQTPDNEAQMLYKMDPAGNVTRLADAPCNMGQKGGGPMQTVDPVSGNLLVFKGYLPEGQSYCPCDNPIYEYDFLTDSWDSIGTHNFANMYGGGMSTVATPLYDYGVIFIANKTNFNGCKIYLYKHREDGTTAVAKNVRPKVPVISLFPNPVKTAARIQYTLKTSGKVFLTVHDICGRQLTILVHDIMEKGTHQVVWNASACKNGVYFCCLETNIGKVTKKIVVVE